MKLNAAEKKVLGQIVEATRNGGSLYTDKKLAERMSKGGLIEVNPAMVDASGNPAARATDAGIKAAETAGTATPRTPIKAPESGFEIETGFTPAPSKRGIGPRASVFPFDKLTNGQSFFIASSADVAEPWKKMQSTVSSATKRFNKEGSTDKRRFVIREELKNPKLAESAENPKGARIYRQDDAPAAAAA